MSDDPKDPKKPTSGEPPERPHDAPDETTSTAGFGSQPHEPLPSSPPADEEVTDEDLPTPDDVTELQEEISDLMDEAETYLERAQEIQDAADEVADEDNPARVEDTLIEEMDRVGDVPALLEQASDLIKANEQGDLPPEKILENFENAEDLVKKARETMDDVGPLPEAQDDEDDGDENDAIDDAADDDPTDGDGDDEGDEPKAR